MRGQSYPAFRSVSCLHNTYIHLKCQFLHIRCQWHRRFLATRQPFLLTLIMPKIEIIVFIRHNETALFMYMLMMCFVRANRFEFETNLVINLPWGNPHIVPK
jgi:hypothetical protein